MRLPKSYKLHNAIGLPTWWKKIAVYLKSLSILNKNLMKILQFQRDLLTWTKHILTDYCCTSYIIFGDFMLNNALCFLPLSIYLFANTLGRRNWSSAINIQRWLYDRRRVHSNVQHRYSCWRKWRRRGNARCFLQSGLSEKSPANVQFVNSMDARTGEASTLLIAGSTLLVCELFSRNGTKLFS